MIKPTFAKTEADLEEIADMMGKIFTRRSYFDFYDTRIRYQTMDPWYKPEHSRIIRENGKIVSHVCIIEKPLQFGPAVIKLAGIGDVFTHPEARGKGYSRLLMEDALRYMKEHDYPLTLLYGIPGYYHKFGYIEALKEYRFFVTVKDELVKDHSFSVREVQDQDIPSLLSIYRNNFHNGCFVVDRTESCFRRLTTRPKNFIVLLDKRNQIAGYANIRDEITNQFVVNEAAADNPAASAALFTEIIKHAPHPVPRQIEIRMSPAMPFVRYLSRLGSELKIKTYSEGEGNAMMAIIDLQKLLTDLIPQFNLRLQRSELHRLSDQLNIETDREKVALVMKNGKIVAVEKSSPNRSDTMKLTADHRYLVRNIVGSWSIENLLETTPAKCSGDSAQRLLNILFPETEPFLLPLDYF